MFAETLAYHVSISCSSVERKNGFFDDRLRPLFSDYALSELIPGIEIIESHVVSELFPEYQGKWELIISL